jgi:hypothetical protein
LPPRSPPAGLSLEALEPPPSPDELEPPPSPERPFEDRDPDELELDRRSTFAQPEPLNTIAGVERAFRIVPSAPHSGQNLGPGSLIP